MSGKNVIFHDQNANERGSSVALFHYAHFSYRRSQWKVRIDGIEAYPVYIQDHQRAIYDTIKRALNKYAGWIGLEKG